MATKQIISRTTKTIVKGNTSTENATTVERKVTGKLGFGWIIKIKKMTSTTFLYVKISTDKSP